MQKNPKLSLNHKITIFSTQIGFKVIIPTDQLCTAAWGTTNSSRNQASTAIMADRARPSRSKPMIEPKEKAEANRSRKQRWPTKSEEIWNRSEEGWPKTPRDCRDRLGKGQAEINTNGLTKTKGKLINFRWPNPYRGRPTTGEEEWPKSPLRGFRSSKLEWWSSRATQPRLVVLASQGNTTPQGHRTEGLPHAW